MLLKNVQPREDTQKALAELAFGRCLNIGTGTGMSANLMLANPKVTSVTTMDAMPEFEHTADPKVEVIPYEPTINRDFDFVFVDDFGKRWEHAKYWFDRGAVVLANDVELVPPMIRGLLEMGLTYRKIGTDPYSPGLITGYTNG